MADIVDAAYRIKKPLQSALFPHGPGKNRSTTQALTIPAVILSKIVRKGNRDFCPFFGPIFQSTHPTESVIATPPPL